MLLHVCCAPDLVPAYFHLKDKIKHIYFYNPNVHPKEEYDKRYKEVLKLARLWGFNIVESKYEPEVFFRYIKDFSISVDEKNSERCDKCIYLRLLDTALTAKKLNFSSFATTLTSSPRKSLEKINKIGKIVERETGVNYIVTHFRKGKEYQQALKFIKENNIYRQNYCGCIFSKKEAEEHRRKVIEKSKNVLKKFGLDHIELFPEKFVINKDNIHMFSENFVEIIKAIRPKLLFVDRFVMENYNLKIGWNKFGNYNQKVQLLEGE